MIIYYYTWLTIFFWSFFLFYLQDAEHHNVLQCIPGSELCGKSYSKALLSRLENLPLSICCVEEC